VHSKALFLALAVPSFCVAAPSQRSARFVVEAPDAKTAAAVARAAERQLKKLSLQWLGRELPDWPEPCPVRVTLGSRGSRGHTTFVFDEGRVTRQEMEVEGTLARILDGVLPHELTHLMLAHHFGRPVPRWADEGGATLSEGEEEAARYRDQMRQLLAAPARCIPLRDLFELAHYPRDLFAFYGSGSSVSRFLVDRKGRKTFLAFVAAGMAGDWDGAVRRFYRFDTVEDLERAWLGSLRKERVAVQDEGSRREALPAPAGAGTEAEAPGGARTR
jgi:hypothetical protein